LHGRASGNCRRVTKLTRSRRIESQRRALHPLGGVKTGRVSHGSAAHAGRPRAARNRMPKASGQEPRIRARRNIGRAGHAGKRGFALGLVKHGAASAANTSRIRSRRTSKLEAAAAGARVEYSAPNEHECGACAFLVVRSCAAATPSTFTFARSWLPKCSPARTRSGAAHRVTRNLRLAGIAFSSPRRAVRGTATHRPSLGGSPVVLQLHGDVRALGRIHVRRRGNVRLSRARAASASGWRRSATRSVTSGCSVSNSGACRRREDPAPARRDLPRGIARTCVPRAPPPTTPKLHPS